MRHWGGSAWRWTSGSSGGASASSEHTLHIDRPVCYVSTPQGRQTCLPHPLDQHAGEPHEDRSPRHRHGRPDHRRPSGRPRPRGRRRHPRPAGHPRPHRARRHGQPAVRGLGGGPRRGRRSPPSPTRQPRRELVVNATSGHGALAGASSRPARTTWPARCSLDISNPLDFSTGFPPTLFVKDTDSLGEQIQRAFPEARVVKTLNTLTAELMVDPSSSARSPRVFVSGDDAEAKATVTELLRVVRPRPTSSTSATSARRAAPRCCCRSGCA